MGSIIVGVFVPFIGTTLGAACVFFMKGTIKATIQKIFLGFAAGVMIAASVWSLIIPAMEMSKNMGKISFLPATVGIILGMALLILMDEFVPKCYLEENGSSQCGGGKFRKSNLFFAVVLHNIPEGMAVGVAYAGLLFGKSYITLAGVIALSFGIAVQNFPEGAIISMPMCAKGMKKGKAFFYGVLSGVVEPIAAIITILLAKVVTPLLPYFLTFAAGAMIYVVMEELMPEAVESEVPKIGTIGFGVGFLIMMILDCCFG